MTDPTVSIPETRIRNQAVFFYLAPAAWIMYLFLLPSLFASNRMIAVLYMIFPGLFLFTWIGYLMHECWHQYVPNVNNRLMYHLLALMILTDPQLYHLIHGSHHSQVHTWNDSEFHPVGEIKSKGWRIVYNWFEFLFGVSFLMAVASVTVPRDPRFSGKYRRWKLFSSILLWTVFLCGVGYLSRHLFGTSVTDTVVSYVLMFWTGSFVLHQSQLVEHGNLIVEGDFHRRNMRSRNLKPSGIAEKLFLFLTHNDSREHVLHHTLTNVYSRPFPGTVPLPEGAVMITLREYFQILQRMLAGRVDREVEAG